MGGKPILVRTLELFEGSSVIEGVVLVAAASEQEACISLVKTCRFRKVRHVVPGGSSRHASEYLGLLALEKEIDSGAVETVVVHDAVRPFVSRRELEAVVTTAQRVGAAILATPTEEHVVRIGEDGLLGASETDLWASQTPQAFRASLLLAAHRRAEREEFEGSDTSSVVERFGARVEVVRGSAGNIKITSSDDLLRAEVLASGFDIWVGNSEEDVVPDL